jgi:hypothetical protein
MGVEDRLRLADSLLVAIEGSLSSLQRLLTEVHKEITLSLRDEIEASRDEVISALRREVDQLREGMASRAVIERAKGILMQMHSVSEAESYALLNETSQRRHRKLRDVAADVVNGILTGSLDAVPPSDVPTDRNVRGQPSGTSLSTRDGPVPPAPS